MTWSLSKSSDPHALAVVDGTGPFAEHGPHYSRLLPVELAVADGVEEGEGFGEEVDHDPDS